MEPNLTNYCSVDASNQTGVNPQEQMLLASQQFVHFCSNASLCPLLCWRKLNTYIQNLSNSRSDYHTKKITKNYPKTSDWNRLHYCVTNSQAPSSAHSLTHVLKHPFGLWGPNCSGTPWPKQIAHPTQGQCSGSPSHLVCATLIGLDPRGDTLASPLTRLIRRAPLPSITILAE